MISFHLAIAFKVNLLYPHIAHCVVMEDSPVHFRKLIRSQIERHKAVTYAVE